MWVMLESLRPVKLNKREAEIVIIEEGPGNKARNCYYGPEAIESGAPIFRGCQCYADHPSHSEQEDLPERSVRDLIGRIKETWVATNPKTGAKQLRGILKINEGKDFEWAVSLIKESIKADEEGFPPVAQVSIHADGDIAPRTVNGHKYNYVSNIKSAVSVDVVTKGGIRNSGFVKFMENALGGRPMSSNTEARFRQIQQKLAESLSGEDAAFLEEYLREDGDEGDAEMDMSGGEDQDYGEEPEVFQDEAGNLFAATGEFDEDGNPIVVDENGEAFAVPVDEFDDEAVMEFEGADDEEYIDEPEFDDEEALYADEYTDEDDVPISALAEQYPHLAHEINMEEMGAMESERDYDLVALKMENKLLKSRMIAEHKLAESGLPEGIIPMAELVGRAPAEMDTLIQSRVRMLETVSGMVRGASAAVVDAGLRESDTGDAYAGRRILRNSLLPS
jgi:hypothetical protein